METSKEAIKHVCELYNVADIGQVAKMRLVEDLSRNVAMRFAVERAFTAIAEALYIADPANKIFSSFDTNLLAALERKRNDWLAAHKQPWYLQAWNRIFGRQLLPS